jgi:hypothetical protein
MPHIALLKSLGISRIFKRAACIRGQSLQGWEMRRWEFAVAGEVNAPA